MISRALSALFLGAPAACSWAAPSVISVPERILQVASEVGIPVPKLDLPAHLHQADVLAAIVEPSRVREETPPDPEETPLQPLAASPVGPPYISRQVSGSGFLSGWANMNCVGNSLQGTVHLSGTIEVRGENGLRGSGQVSGTAHLSGTCFNGTGTAHGSAFVNGYASIYDSKGQSVGSAHLSGFQSVTVFYPSSWLNVHVNVSGSF